MKSLIFTKLRAFTLLETVIATGVLAVLLTGFMVVFAPAAAGIKKSINVQEADRLATAIEQELITNRPKEPGSFTTGFEKAYRWIESSKTADTALLVYQYRGAIKGVNTLRDDKTYEPIANVSGMAPGKDYVVIPMVRRKNDPKLKDDLKAIEGSVYLVKCTQLVFGTGTTTGLIESKSLKIVDPKGTSGSGVTGPDDYPEAVIAFSANFYTLPSKSESFFASSFSSKFDNFKSPVFTRNMAVRR